MKKILSKIGIMMLLTFSCLAMPVLESKAADGTMQISDSAAAVGDIATVTVTVESDGAELGDCEATLSYDTTMLEFVEGTYAEATDEGVWIAQYGTGTETIFTFDLQFRVLEEGSSTITLTDSKAYLYSDETLYLQATGGTISSEETEVVSGDPIEMNGMTYYFYDDFSDALMLEGFSKDTMEYAGAAHNVMVQSITGKTAAYFVTGESDPVLAVYNESTGAFELAELVSVSNDYFLILLGNADGSGLSGDYAETTIEVNGTVFPAWQNMDETDYFLVYALSSEGMEGYYQYDSREGTYQRYIKPATQTAAEDSKFDNVILNKLNELINDNFIYVLAGVVIVILIMMIIIIVMSSVIGKRNAEIDDLYDEMENGDPLNTEDDNHEYDESEEDYDFDDEYDDEEDYEFDDDDDEDYDLDDEYDDEDYDFDDEYDDEDYDFDDDLDEAESYETSPVKKKKTVSRDTYEYSVDFIDL